MFEMRGGDYVDNDEEHCSIKTFLARNSGKSESRRDKCLSLRLSEISRAGDEEFKQCWPSSPKKIHF